MCHWCVYSLLLISEHRSYCRFNRKQSFISPGCPWVLQYLLRQETPWTWPCLCHGLWSDRKKQNKKKVFEHSNGSFLLWEVCRTHLINTLLFIKYLLWQWEFVHVYLFVCKSALCMLYICFCLFRLISPAACDWRQRWSSALWCACVRRCGYLCTGQAYTSLQSPPSFHLGPCGSQTAESSSRQPGK